MLGRERRRRGVDSLRSARTFVFPVKIYPPIKILPCFISCTHLVLRLLAVPVPGPLGPGRDLPLRGAAVLHVEARLGVCRRLLLPPGASGLSLPLPLLGLDDFVAKVLKKKYRKLNIIFCETVFRTCSLCVASPSTELASYLSISSSVRSPVRSGERDVGV